MSPAVGVVAVAAAAAAFTAAAGMVVDFEDLAPLGEARPEERIVIHRPDNGRVVFSAIPYFDVTDAAVGAVRNDATSACTGSDGADVKLGTGRLGIGMVGRAGFAIRADFEPPLETESGEVFVAAEFQTGTLVEVRVELYGAGGAVVGEATGRGTKDDGRCDYPGGPRTRVEVVAHAKSTVHHAVLDAEPWRVKPVGHVFVVDNVRFGAR